MERRLGKMTVSTNPTGMTAPDSDLYPSRVGDRTLLLPRRDPTVYADPAAKPPIPKDQVDFYEENGYLFLESFFSEQELTAMRAELQRLREECRGSTRDEVILEPDGDDVRSIFAVHRDSELYRQYSRHPRLLAIVEHLLGSEVYIHQSRINFKPGFTGKDFYWHSDFETWHVEDGMPRMRALSCSIWLDDNYTYNGPVMVVPGSHKTYVSCAGETPEENYKTSLRKQIYGVPDRESLTSLVDRHGIETPIGPAGSILLFDCNVMHGSNGNMSPKPRSNVFLVYNSVENRLVEPFSGRKPRPGYIAER